MKILKYGSIVLIFLILCWGLILFLDAPSRQIRTTSNMSLIRMKILELLQKDESVQISLSALLLSESKQFVKADAWGNEFRMIKSGNEVRIESYGADNRPGGSGDDADIVGVFKIKDENGKFYGEGFETWVIDPRKK